jgi:hypothetical protein
MYRSLLMKNKLYFLGSLLLCSYAQIRLRSVSFCNYFVKEYIINILKMVKELYNFLFVN